MELAPYLQAMVEKQASDLYLSTGAPACIKIEGVTSRFRQEPMKPGQVKQLAYSMMNDRQKAIFEKEWELDMAISIADVGRFRINVFLQRGEVAMVVRFIKSDVPSIESLNLPPLLQLLSMETRGLILLVGATGSGKSTTLASMLDYRNTHATGHILTIEDPIEYLHHHKHSVINQREVGMDTHSYQAALRRAMREAPDVIMIGEIRDQETMRQALTYAETGHLCLSTLHAGNAIQTLRRIVNFFPESAHSELFMDLSMHLKAIVSQRLLVGTDKKRLPAVEVMITSPFIRELIHKGEIDGITEVMEKSEDSGMQTFDHVLLQLCRSGRISKEEALKHADSRSNLNVQFRLQKGMDADTGGIEMKKD